MDHSSVIDDVERALGDTTDEAFATRFTGPNGRPISRPAVRGWRLSGIPLARMIEIATLLNSSGAEWPDSFAELYRERVVDPAARIG